MPKRMIHAIGNILMLKWTLFIHFKICRFFDTFKEAVFQALEEFVVHLTNIWAFICVSLV